MVDVKTNKTFEVKYNKNDIDVLIEIDDNKLLSVWDVYTKQYLKHIPEELFPSIVAIINASMGITGLEFNLPVYSKEKMEKSIQEGY